MIARSNAAACRPSDSGATPDGAHPTPSGVIHNVWRWWRSCSEFRRARCPSCGGPRSRHDYGSFGWCEQ